MGVIRPEDLGGDVDLARRVIARARSIAPRLDSITDAEDLNTVGAILRGVMAEAVTRGARSVRRQSIGPASVEYTDASSWFSADDIASLRSLCASVPALGLPVGSFPLERPVSRLWPETY